MVTTTPVREGLVSSRLRRDPIPHGLLDARITHTRHGAKPYVLTHRLSYLNVPLSDLHRLPRLFLRRNRWALFALNDRDYGTGQRPLPDWVKEAFAVSGIDAKETGITLLTLPRVLGFSFNPVSFWLCHDETAALIAVLAEVNNTFGERHCYLCRKPDGTPIGNDDEIVAEKVFHVSPFFPTDGEYRFRFIEKPGRLAIRIDLHREGRRALTATISGRTATLHSAALLRRFLRHPFPTLQVILLIHYHAARLYLAGAQFFSKPKPPDTLITTSRAASAPVLNAEPT